MSKRAVVLHSGGLDSSTLLYYVQNHGLEPYGLSISYGQRHERELGAAYAIADQLDVSHRAVDLKALRSLLTNSVLTDHARELPQGLYDAANMSQTVVPNRNMILLAVAAGYADSIGASAVFTAVHAGDHAIYPDCRPEFLDAANEAVKLATEGRVRLAAPFIHMTKTQIVEVGYALGVPFALTYSCYSGHDKHCGLCGTCTERIEAFLNAHVEDPTEYESGAKEKAIAMLRNAHKI